MWLNTGVDALNAGTAGSDVVTFVSPSYKAAYSGLSKVLDCCRANGLCGVTASTFFIAADHTGFMGASVNLSPLLVEFGAVASNAGSIS